MHFALLKTENFLNSTSFAQLHEFFIKKVRSICNYASKIN